MAITIERAAARMGMKPFREVVSVVETPDGDVVTTHDGVHTLIRADGSMVFHVAAPVAVAAPELEESVEPEDAPEPEATEPGPATTEPAADRRRKPRGA